MPVGGTREARPTRAGTGDMQWGIHSITPNFPGSTPEVYAEITRSCDRGSGPGSVSAKPDSSLRNVTAPVQAPVEGVDLRGQLIEPPDGLGVAVVP